MPKRRACRKKVVNYRLSDSENEEEFSRTKVQLKSNSQQNSNKSVKYYISSDSESEDERKRNTQKRNRTSSSQDVVEASGSNEDNSMDRAFTLASSAIIAEVNTLLATTQEAFTKWRERKVQEEEIKTPETNQVIDLTNSNNVKKPKKEETPILVGDDDSNTDKLKDPTVQNADEENSNGLECPICLESLRNKRAMLTPCGHYFCADCIKIHLSSNKNCPTCRKKCTVKRLYPFYM